MAWSDAARAAAAEARKRNTKGVGFTAKQRAYGLHKMSKRFSKGVAGALVGAPPKGFFDKNDRLQARIGKILGRKMVTPENYTAALHQARKEGY